MKFGKEFTSQMVPEWQQAYMDYEYLKSHLKIIQDFKLRNSLLPPPPPPATISSRLKRRHTLYRAFSGLTHRISRSPRNDLTRHDLESQAILVNYETSDGGNGYETMFLMASDEGGQHELVYFKRLDDELNKVVKFYKDKVAEVVKEADLLSKQMDALIGFRIKVDDPQVWFDGEREMNRLVLDVSASSAALSASTPAGARYGTRRIQIDTIDEETDTINQNDKEQERSRDIRPSRPAPLEILNRVTMNNTVETPRSTIKGILNVSNETELRFSKENLMKVEQQLKKAFIEFHHKLRLLKSYSFMNILAFSKIMKKYDKIASRNASKSYLKMVDNSYLGSSDEVTKLMERVEATFIKHFSNSNRSKGMNSLRPKAKRERHRITFFLGLFVGCTIALMVALILVVHTRDILAKDGVKKYMETMFPLYSLFGFIFLHMVMYAANIYFWRRYRVNYSFIFGFKEGTELGYREVLLLSFGLAVLGIATTFGNLDMNINTETDDYKPLSELLPLGVVVLLVVMLLCPFNIIYRSSRFFFLACIFHCICAPLYKVLLPDFFLADQLTSQVQAFRNLEFYICYYSSGDYRRRESSCKSNDVFLTFDFIVAGIPYTWRLLQCLRRLFEERDAMQGLNGLKYFSTIVAISTRTAYKRNTKLPWRFLPWVTSIIAAVFGTYWDLIVDWGLLQWSSKNFLLRDKLLIPHKSVYFVAMVVNVVLRLAWLQTVTNLEVPFLHAENLIAVVAVLEIFRRGIWNFFRLENEHLNNVGKYRAFKSVPLPFNYDEDEDKDR